MGGAHSGGGSLVLASLIDKAGEVLYQDFQSEYHLDFIDCVNGAKSPLEIIMLIRGLKLGSRFVALLQGSTEFVSWDVNTYQLATLIDSVNNVNYAVVAANSKRKPKAPKPSYRPKKGGRRSVNQFQLKLDQQKQRKAKGG